MIIDVGSNPTIHDEVLIVGEPINDLGRVVGHSTTLLSILNYK